VALGAAVEYVTALGFDRIHAQEQALLEHATRLLSAIPGVTIYGPAVEHKGAIVSFTVDGVHPHDLADLLDREGVAIRAGHHCTMPLHDRLQLAATARASFAFYNTHEEVEALAAAIRNARRVFRLPD
jgi:cysteine desulfurase/selenocysteine lyase